MVEATTGMIVKSIAGHDKNRFMVITAVNDGIAFVCDGKERTLTKPKKKNLLHLRLTKTVIDLSEITDKKLREILREYSGENQ